ncbi:MAG: hypothetical protein A2301_01020 [Candidatus Magasanikbacteria bacterium RIFOXYB2_FULL_40_13]|nr:MAG: hypothetical protein A2301_01020 [Candidatus Magasanikbacteria bacterium RIFOXYB2_FULL_40_13]
MKNKIIAKFKDFWRVNPAPSCNVENDAGRIVFMSNYFRNKLSGIFRRCWIKRNQKLMFSFFVLFVVGGLLNATAVHAIPEVITDFFSDIGGDILGGLIQLISGMLMFLAGLCIKATLFFWEYFMELAGYNDFMNAPPVKIGWIMIRDLANMFFIVALMVIAIGTVLGVEQYEWKKSLVKLIFAAIFINFSKLILQLVLDFTGIIMQTFLIAFKGQSGNLIKIFSLNQITELLNSGGGTGSFNYKLFIASVVALTMAMLVMLTTGAYLVVMIGRMIVLWMLMIISPLAFILSAFPFGKQYASEFWKNFFNYAMVGPIMVFFSWLAFASLQTGRISTEINLEVDKLKNAGTAIGGEIGEESAISINQASTWENLASYFIALGFFVVGITMVGRMGVVGGGMVSKAMDFTKKVATIASGYAAGRWLVDRGIKKTRESGERIALATGKLAKGGLRLGVEKTGIPQKIYEKRMDKDSRLGRLLNAPQRGRAALERLGQLEEDRKRAIKATAGASRLAPDEKMMAMQQVIAEDFEKAKENRIVKYKHEARAERSKKDLPEFADEKARLMSTELGIDVKTHFVNDKGENLWSNVEKAVESGDVNAYEGAMKKIEDQVRIYDEVKEQAKAGNWEGEGGVSKLMDGAYGLKGYTNMEKLRTDLSGLEKNPDGSYTDIAQVQAQALFDNFNFESNPLFSAFNEARDSIKRGDEASALKAVNRAIVLDPENVILKKAAIDLEKGNLLKANASLDKYSEQNQEVLFLEKTQKAIDNNNSAETERSFGAYLEDQEGYASYRRLNEAVGKKDTDAVVNASEGMRSAVGIKQEYSQALKRDIDRKSAKSSAPVISRILEEMAAEEMAGTEKAAMDTLKGMFSHSYLKEEQKQLKTRKKAVDEKMISEKLADIQTEGDKNLAHSEYAKGWLENLYSKYAEDVEEALKDPETIAKIVKKYKLADVYGVSEKEVVGALSIETEKADTKEAKKRTLVAAIEGIDKEDLDSLENESEKGKTADRSILIKNIEKAKSHPPKVDEDSVLRAYAEGTIMGPQRAQAYEDMGVFDGLDKIQGEYDEYKAGNRNRKYSKELEGIKGHVADIIRVQEGKPSDRLRRWEEADVRERLSDYNDYEYEKLTNLIMKDAAQMQNYRKKGKLTPEEKKAMQSTSQNLSTMMAVMMKNFTGSMPGLIESTNKSFQGKDFDTGDNIGRAVTAIVTGADWSDVENDDGFQKVEQQMRSNFKEKENRLMRVMAEGYQGAANNGSTHYYRQISEGKDRYGNDVFGNTVLMKDGIGDGKNLGTGKKGVMGQTYRSGEERDMLYPSRNFNSAKDTRAFIQMKNGKGVAYRNKYDELSMRGIADKTADQIRNLAQNYLWSGFGGGYGTAPWDGQEFDAKTEPKIALALTFKRMMGNHNTAKDRVAKGRELEKFKALLNKLGVDRVGKDGDVILDKATIEDVKDFLNEKLITGMEGQASSHTGDEVERLEVR